MNEIHVERRRDLHETVRKLWMRHHIHSAEQIALCLNIGIGRVKRILMQEGLLEP